MSQKRSERISLLRNYKFDAPLVEESYQGTPYTLTDDTRVLFNRIFLLTINESLTYPCPLLTRPVYKSIISQVEFLLCRCSNVIRDNYLSRAKQHVSRCCSIPTPILRLLNFCQNLYKVVSNQDKIGFNLDLDWINFTILENNWVRIEIAKDQHHVVLDYLLMIFTRSLDTLCGLLFAHCESGVTYSTRFYELTFNLIKTIHSDFLKRGHKMIDLMKSWEALLIGIVLKNEEQLMDNSEFLDKTILELQNLKLNPEKYVRILCDLPSFELLELIGLTKYFGHPFLKGEEGLVKLITADTKEKTLDLIFIQEARNLLIRDYCKEFLKVKGRWPTVTLEYGVHPIIEQAVLTNKWISHPSFSKFGPKVKLIEWTKVTPCQEMTFDIKHNIIPFLKDRSIAVCKSDAVEHYINGKNLRWSEKKCLLRFLTLRDAGQDLLKYMNLAAIGWDEVNKDLVIKLSRKEGELKKEGRFFGQTTFNNRLCLQLKEYNLSRFLDWFNPDQAMTPTFLELAKKMYSLSRLKFANPNTKVVFLTADTSKWCGSFRSELTDPFGQLFNQIFDTTHWGDVMGMFKRTHFYVPTREECFVINGIDGGIEGLQQKFWGLTYNKPFQRAIMKKGYASFSFYLGDNWIAGIEIPQTKIDALGLQYIVDDIKNGLLEAASKIGLILNRIESFASLKLISFVKEYQLDCAYACSGLKKASKIHCFDNSLLPTLNESVASIYSNAHSASGKCTNPLTMQIIAELITTWFLLINHHLDETQKFLILTIPNVLGGFPIFHLDQMVVRAENDHLTNIITYLKFLCTKYPDISEQLIAPLNQPLCKKVNSVRLLGDPYSVNIDQPPRAFNIIKRFISAQIIYHIKDRNLRRLLGKRFGKRQREFCDHLLTARPFYPKIMSAIYAASPYALKDDLVAIIETTQTMFQLLSLGRGQMNAKSVLNRAALADLRWFEWLLTMFQGQPHRFCSQQQLQEECPTKLAMSLREKSWNIHMEGVTYAHFTEVITYITTDFFELSREGQKRYFLGKVASTLIPQGLKANHHFCVSEPYLTPFLGQTTATKLERMIIKGSKLSPTVSRVSSLLDIYAFTKLLGSNLATQIIYPVLSCYTDLPIAVLSPFAPTKQSGSSTHRLPLRSWRNQVVPNERYNRYNLIRLESSTHELLRGDTVDYNINFLHLYCLQSQVMLFELLISEYLTTPEKLFYFVTTTCPYCIQDVSDQPIIVPEKSPVQSIDPSNPYLTLTKAELEDIAMSVETAIKEKAIYTARQDPLLTAQDHQYKIGVARWSVCHNILINYQQYREAVKMTGASRYKRQELHPLVGVDTYRPSLNDIRAVPPNVWVMTLSTQLAAIVMKELKTHSPTHALLSIDSVSYEVYPYHDLFDLFRDSWVVEIILNQAYSIYNVSPPFNASIGSGPFQQYLARCSLTYPELDADPFIYIFDNTRQEIIEYQRSMKWYPKLVKLGKDSIVDYTDEIEMIVIALIIYYSVKFSLEDFDNDRIVLPLFDIDGLSSENLPESDDFFTDRFLSFYKVITDKKLVVETLDWDDLIDCLNNDYDELSHHVFLKSEGMPFQILNISRESAIQLSRDNAEKEWYNLPKRSNFDRYRRVQLICPIPKDDDNFSTNELQDEQEFDLSIPNEPPSAKERCVLELAYTNRILGGNVSAASKLWSIYSDPLILEWIRVQKRSLHLADGAGGYASLTAYLLHQPEQVEVVTLPIETHGRHLTPLVEPIAWNVSSRVTTSAGPIGLGDLLSMDTHRYIRSMESFDIITFDAELKILNEQYSEMVRLSMETINLVLRSGGLMIFKTFLSKEKWLGQLLSSAAEMFAVIKIVKPNTSGYTSGEIFVIGLNKYHHSSFNWRMPDAHLWAYMNRVCSRISNQRERYISGVVPDNWNNPPPVLEGAPNPGVQLLQNYGFKLGTLELPDLIQQIQVKLKYMKIKTKERATLQALLLFMDCQNLHQLRIAWKKAMSISGQDDQFCKHINRSLLVWRLFNSEQVDKEMTIDKETLEDTEYLAQDLEEF